MRDLALPEGVTDEHFTNRRTMLEAVDGHFRLLENSDKLDAMDLGEAEGHFRYDRFYVFFTREIAC